MSRMQDQTYPNYFRIAWQSALAAALCLGVPAGLLLWLILLQQISDSVVVTQSLAFLQANGLNKVFVLAVCSLLWSYLLGKISGYRPRWKIGLATAAGILVGWFSPLSNMDAWFGEGTPIHIIYAVAMCGIIGSATLCVGLACGLLLKNIRAALMMAFTTTLVSVLTLVLTIAVFDQFGIRVGGIVPLAMSKVTSVSLLMSAITGGAILGVEFTRFMREQKDQASEPKTPAEVFNGS